MCAHNMRLVYVCIFSIKLSGYMSIDVWSDLWYGICYYRFSKRK